MVRQAPSLLVLPRRVKVFYTTPSVGAGPRVAERPLVSFADKILSDDYQNISAPRS
jgi:hypothetical protein